MQQRSPPREEEELARVPSKNSAQSPLIDISMLLSPRTATFPGDPMVAIETVKGESAEDAAVVHRFCMGSHSGTHIDAPAHMIRDGLTLPQIDLARLIGECTVLDCTDCDNSIDAALLRQREIPHKQRVLLKTRNSRVGSIPEFQQDFVYLTPDGATFLADLGAWLVGIDYLSIGQIGPRGIEAHRALFAHNVVILEGLDLSRVVAGSYELLCLPLKLDVPDGAPVRAMLRPLMNACNPRAETRANKTPY